MLARYTTLKERHRDTRGGMPEALNLRIHRALSWLHRAAQCPDDPDARFVFLWIAFNAAYAQEIPESVRLPQQAAFGQFLHKLHSLDTQHQLDQLVWNTYSGPIRVLLNNPYVFTAFWSYQRGEISQEQWQARFAAGKSKAHALLADNQTPALLGLVFQRIYVLRNQLMHGGATWNSATNRAQVQDCANLMGQLVPVVIEIMLSNPNTLWGNACYPVVTE